MHIPLGSWVYCTTLPCLDLESYLTQCRSGRDNLQLMSPTLSTEYGSMYGACPSQLLNNSGQVSDRPSGWSKDWQPVGHPHVNPRLPLWSSCVANYATRRSVSCQEHWLYSYISLSEMGLEPLNFKEKENPPKDRVSMTLNTRSWSNLGTKAYWRLVDDTKSKTNSERKSNLNCECLSIYQLVSNSHSVVFKLF